MRAYIGDAEDVLELLWFLLATLPALACPRHDDMLKNLLGQGWLLMWRWKSRSRRGRRHLNCEVRDLITTMSRDNRLWGTERITGEWLKVGIDVGNRSIPA